MNLEEARQALVDAWESGNVSGRRDARLRAVRQVLISRGLALLGMERCSAQPIDAVVQLAAQAHAGPGRRDCAALLVHALAMRGVVPAALAGEVCALAESALRDVLIRCDYPFGGSIREKLGLLERLHGKIGELMQPLEPTFPNWQGLYAG